MNEMEYEQMQSDAAIGKVVQENLAAILQGRTLAQLQRDAYKYTDAGVSVSFMLVDGSYLYSGDPRANDPAMVNHVAAVGVSSIVEGSDAEVPVEWIYLDDGKYGDEGGDQLCLADYDDLVERVNDAACELSNDEDE